MKNIKNLNKKKMEIWAAQNQVYRAQTLHGNVTIESVLGETRKLRVEGLMDELDAAGEIY